ncbi:hypothetical protein C8F01DRAFT_1264168 [Mycena amicta]|nr:hypothetical protein C8F01DRAFT_1264168 [Mycena amicta]
MPLIKTGGDLASFPASIFSPPSIHDPSHLKRPSSSSVLPSTRIARPSYDGRWNLSRGPCLAEPSLSSLTGPLCCRMGRQRGHVSARKSDRDDGLCPCVQVWDVSFVAATLALTLLLVFSILTKDETKSGSPPQTQTRIDLSHWLLRRSQFALAGRQFLVFVPSPSPLPSATYPGIRQEREGSCSSTSTYGRRTVLQAKPPCLSYSSVGPGSATLASVRLGLGSESESESESESSPSDDSALMAEQVRIACMKSIRLSQQLARKLPSP